MVVGCCIQSGLEMVTLAVKFYNQAMNKQKKIKKDNLCVEKAVIETCGNNRGLPTKIGDLDTRFVKISSSFLTYPKLTNNLSSCDKVTIFNYPS